MRKLLCILLITALTVTLVFTSASAADSRYTDISGHWAESAINNWSDKDVIQGYDGKFRPDDPISRGEFAVILDRIMNYRYMSDNSFSDLGTAFYTNAILKAAHYGVIKGYSDNTVKPETNITRQEAAVMISRAFRIPNTADYTMKDKDVVDIAAFAKPAMATLEAIGVLHGRGDGNMYPLAAISRAEVVFMLNNLIADIYSSAGTYTKDAAGYVIVNAPGVQLKKMTITGTLIAAPGVGNGDLTLDGATVKGNVVLMGGDVILEGSFNSVTVDGEVSLTLPSGSSINYLILNAPGDINGSGTVQKAVVNVGASGSAFDSRPTCLTGPSGLTVTIRGTVFLSDGVNFNQPNSGIAITASAAKLNMSGASTLTAGNVGGTCTFDLSESGTYSDALSITSFRIDTNCDTVFNVYGYTFNTNEDIPMNSFRSILGLSPTGPVSLGTLRRFAESFTVSGTIDGGGSLTLTFVMGSGGYYDITSNGTTLTAKLKHPAASFHLPVGYDPVKAFIAKIGDQGASTIYRLESMKFNLDKTYTGYSSIQSLTLSGLITLLETSSGTAITGLSDLTGSTLTLTYGSTVMTLSFV